MRLARELPRLGVVGAVAEAVLQWRREVEVAHVVGVVGDRRVGIDLGRRCRWGSGSALPQAVARIAN
jgi:hypothetical protein